MENECAETTLGSNRTSEGIQDTTFDSEIFSNTISQLNSSSDNFLINPEKEFEAFSIWMDQSTASQKAKFEDCCKSFGDIETISLKMNSLTAEIKADKEKLVTMKIARKEFENEKKLLTEMKEKYIQEIECSNEELQQLISDLPQLKIDVCDKVENLKDTYNAYNYASKFYQKYLHIYVDIETVDPLLFNIYLFTSNANNKDYSVTLQKNIDKKWILLKITPEIPKNQFDLLRDKLLANGDLRYLLCSVRKIFLQDKDKENTNINCTLKNT